jgi:hypothetical protein
MVSLFVYGKNEGKKCLVLKDILAQEQIHTLSI